MRRALIVAVVALTTGTPTFQAQAHGNAAQECRYKRGGGFSDRDVKATIRCAARRWHVPGGYPKARSVARCESGFNEHNSYAGHDGVYQHDRRYWPGRFRRFRVRGWRMHPSVFNARSNVVVSIRMAHAGGWSPWSCA